MKILVLNAGSSSLKCQLIDTESEASQIRLLADGIGLDRSQLVVQIDDSKDEKDVHIKDHNAAIEAIADELSFHGFINSPDDIDGIGHRVVHGGEFYNKATEVDDHVVADIGQLAILAPLHNPHNLAGIKACAKKFPGVRQVAVFDTAYHQTLPEIAYLYGLPYKFYKDFKIRKYGFHGTSHKYVANKAAQILGEDIKKFNIITCHMGNGSSVCAIKGGKSIDTSMGFTPLDGMIMGTRAGSFDPEILVWLQKQKGYSVDDVERIINKESGLKGLSEETSDVRDLHENDEHGDAAAHRALDILAYRTIQIIGSYIGVLGGADLIVFTGGIGEKAHYLRRMICKQFEYLGLKIDEQANNENRQIITAGSKIIGMVVPTNEELQIARETKEVLDNQKPAKPLSSEKSSKKKVMLAH